MAEKIAPGGKHMYSAPENSGSQENRVDDVENASEENIYTSICCCGCCPYCCSKFWRFEIRNLKS